MTTEDPITHACRLLREAAQELACGVSINGAPDWANEPDAKAAHDENMAASAALEKMTCFEAGDIATAAAEGFRDGGKAAVREMQPALEKALGQRRVLCDLLRECIPVIDALMQVPGDDDSDARLNGLAGRIMDALNVIAEEQVKGGEA